MRFTTLLVSSSSLALLVVGAPLNSADPKAALVNGPTPRPVHPRDASTASAASLVKLSVFADVDCNEPAAGANVTDGQMDMVGGRECLALGDAEGTGDGSNGITKWGGLKVEWADEKLQYNSLRVYESSNCTGGWTLQPIRCGSDDGSCACSRIPTYYSIKLEAE